MEPELHCWLCVQSQKRLQLLWLLDFTSCCVTNPKCLS